MPTSYWFTPLNPSIPQLINDQSSETLKLKSSISIPTNNKI